VVVAALGGLWLHPRGLLRLQPPGDTETVSLTPRLSFLEVSVV